MKKYIALIFFIVFVPIILNSQSETEAVASFKSIVKSVDDLFSTSPIVLNSEKLSSSPSGKINYLLKFEKLDVAYDIKKTDSLVSPFTATISVTLHASTNAKFGDIPHSDTRMNSETLKDEKITWNWGFQRAEDALDKKDFGTCTDLDKRLALAEDHIEKVSCHGEATLLYAYQDNKWILKDVLQDDSVRIQDGQTSRVLRDNLLSNPDWAKYIMPKK